MQCGKCGQNDDEKVWVLLWCFHYFIRFFLSRPRSPVTVGPRENVKCRNAPQSSAILFITVYYCGTVFSSFCRQLSAGQGIGCWSGINSTAAFDVTNTTAGKSGVRSTGWFKVNILFCAWDNYLWRDEMISIITQVYPDGSFVWLSLLPHTDRDLCRLDSESWDVTSP